MKNNAKTTGATLEIITRENVKTMGERIAIRALKTIIDKSSRMTENTANKSGGQYNAIYNLYIGLIQDIRHLSPDFDSNESINYTISDGYDIAGEAIKFLMGYVDKGLTLESESNESDKQGNKITIKRACFRKINRYIMAQKQREYKFTYLSEFDDNGEHLVQVSFEWDMPTITDYNGINNLIKALKLSNREKVFLTYRLRGKSLSEIADNMGIKRDTLNIYAKRIKDKAKKMGFTLENGDTIEGLEEYVKALKATENA